ncbi:MAG: hypothetical protein LM550_10880 [Candidatus Contendobacter sp.]|mgnify:CR=1 FL=1|nr:hypothetical protein [Candidatus Contendobacter sp.]
MKKLLFAWLLSLSMTAYAGNFDWDWVGTVLQPMLYKASIKEAQVALTESRLNPFNEPRWFASPSDSTSESMPDGNIIKIYIYGPSDNPWLALYSINGILVKFKTLD